MGSVDRSNAATTGTNREQERMKNHAKTGQKSPAKKMDKQGKDKTQSKSDLGDKKVKAKKIKVEKTGLLGSGTANCESKGTTKPGLSPKKDENKPSTSKSTKIMEQIQSSKTTKRKPLDSGESSPSKVRKIGSENNKEKEKIKKGMKKIKNPDKDLELNTCPPKRSSALNASAILNCLYDRSSQPKIKVEEPEKLNESSEVYIKPPTIKEENPSTASTKFLVDSKNKIDQIQDLKQTTDVKEQSKYKKKKGKQIK